MAASIQWIDSTDEEPCLQDADTQVSSLWSYQLVNNTLLHHTHAACIWRGRQPVDRVCNELWKILRVDAWKNFLVDFMLFSSVLFHLQMVFEECERHHSTAEYSKSLWRCNELHENDLGEVLRKEGLNRYIFLQKRGLSECERVRVYSSYINCACDCERNRSVLEVDFSHHSQPAAHMISYDQYIGFEKH